MESLPRGLVSTSGRVTSELGGIDAVDVGDIVQLWKAYSTKPSVHEGDKGFRLQNFFWRIWSSKRLSGSLTGSTLARLFLHVSEPSSLMPAVKESDHPSSGLKHGKDHPSTTTTSTTITTPATGKATVSASASTSKSPLHPILKKSNSSSHGETQKTTRLLLTGLGGQSVTRKPSNPLTPIPPSRPIMFGEQVNRQGQKKAFVVPSKAKGAKRRPVLMRRKSSQQTSACSTRAHSPDSDPPSPVSTIAEPPFEPPVQEAERSVGSSAEVASQSNKITQPTQPMQLPPHPLDNEEVIVDDTPPEERTSTNTTEYEDLIADPNHKRPFYLFPDEQKEIPPAFLAKLKDLLHKETPLGRLPFRGERPLVGFFSTTACRSFDVRHLSEENYEPPSSYTLVEKDFRTRFAEQKRIAEEYWQMQMSKSLGEGRSGTGAAAFDGAEPRGTSTPTTDGDNGAGGTGGAFSGLDPALPTSTTLGTGTAETISPSRFGDSQSQGIPTVASSMGTSLLVGNSHSHSPGMDTDSFSLVEGPTTTAMSYQTPLALSLPQGPSQISLMVQESRRQRLSSSEIEDGLKGESEGEGDENENGNEETR
ncbi:hypothetical protein ASPCAL04138 [Aspergillus calidoustus]|uniref:Nitrogen regulatory protein areA GATA-like domain-containing protein n=1 Tax=Aspergillus calidoustus TaxID=454130 RepID=A0A0U5FTW2_ASPCI|nr:hypothetical protein ASPCAL04138 [Aspergillus calidoustus]